MTDNQKPAGGLPGQRGHGCRDAAPGPGPAAAVSQASRVTVDSPEALLAVVPHLLGFHPADSLVVLGLSGRRSQVRLTFRYDLPEPPDPALAAEIAGHAAAVLARQQIVAAVIVGYGPGRLVTPLADLLRVILPGSGIAIRELLRAESGRYWSYLCHDPSCCGADGAGFDAAGHPAALALRRAGLAAYPDRAQLAATLAELPDGAASMTRATDVALRRAARLARAAPDGGPPRLVEAGREAVREAIGRYRSGGKITEPDRLAWLSVVLTDVRVRDDAWARMDPAFREAHQRLWSDVVRRARPAQVPAPASLLAFSAWQSGDGALALVAIERALGAHPGYSMALLLARAINAGLPPSAARLPMTPEEVAASYAGTVRRAPGPGSQPSAAAPAKRSSSRLSRRPSG